jgi:Rrf2 family transcriptional regulator, nitric oxide-sensitive transcriptional repressor
LRKALARARSAFIKVLDDYTLSDLVKPRTSLQAMLAIAPVKPARDSSNKPRRRQAGGTS